MTERFDDLVQRFLAEFFDAHPLTATSKGVDGYEGKVADVTAAGIAARFDLYDRWYAAFRAVSDDGTTPDEQIDRDLILSVLRGRQIMRPWDEWRRQPSTYLDPILDGVFTPFLHRSLPEADLVDAAAAVMRQAPGVARAGMENLDASLVPRVFAERALGHCTAAISYVRDQVPLEAGSPAARAQLAEAGAVAARAFEEFLGFLQELAREARGDFAVGEEIYDRLLTEKEALSFGARELRERGRAEFETLSGQMSEIARDLTGSPDWHAAVADLMQDHPGTPDEMRAAYETWTERARRFLIERDLVTMPPGEQCLVVPSPPFERPVLAVASYHQPPAFKPSLTGHFFVPYPPDGVSQEEIQKRLASNNHMSIPTTSVHEAYPGHHWHLITAGANPRPARKVFSTAYFNEGWALYSEIMMRDEGFYEDPKHLLGVAEARIFRAARIVVDTSLHLGEMAFEEAVAFMRENAGLSEPTARAEVTRYCAWPTQASAYLTGSLEIERMRDRWLRARPGDLKGFHDTIAASGSLPLGLAERALGL